VAKDVSWEICSKRSWTAFIRIERGVDPGGALLRQSLDGNPEERMCGFHRTCGGRLAEILRNSSRGTRRALEQNAVAVSGLTGRCWTFWTKAGVISSGITSWAGDQASDAAIICSRLKGFRMVSCAFRLFFSFAHGALRRHYDEGMEASLGCAAVRSGNWYPSFTGIMRSKIMRPGRSFGESDS